MGRIVVEGRIPAAPEKVWEYCKDIGRTPEWFPAIAAVRATGDRTEGVGAEYEFTARNAGRIVTYRMVVTDWDEGRRVRQEVVPRSGKGVWSGLLGSMSVVWEYRPGDGGTLLSAAQEMKLNGPADLLTMPWLLIFDRRLYKRAFRRLAEIMQERASS